MTPARHLLVLLFVFVILSGLNYFYYYERTEALNAQSREAIAFRCHESVGRHCQIGADHRADKP